MNLTKVLMLFWFSIYFFYSSVLSAETGNHLRRLLLEARHLHGPRYEVDTNKILIINFWAPWCEPCRAEMPELVELSQKYFAHARFVGIAVDNNQVLIKKFVDDHGIPFTILGERDFALKILREVGNFEAFLPYTVILSEKDIVIFKKRGRIKKNDMHKYLGKS